MGHAYMLKIPERILNEVTQICVRGYPHEVCGLLVGRTIQGINEVLQWLPARNLNTERPKDRYEMDPKDFLRADREARRQGLAIVGIYHSHPDHSPQASATDTEQAWEGYSYLILAVYQQKLDKFQSWRFNGQQMMEEEIEVTHGEGSHSDPLEKFHSRER